MERDKVIEKVAKLLALSKSDNEGEAFQALKAAQKLIAQYHLQQEDLKENDSVITKHVDEETKSVSWYRKQIAITLAPLFRCKCILSNNYNNKFNTYSRILFIGESIDVQMVIKAFEYASNAYNSLFTKFIKDKSNLTRSEKSKERNVYTLGFCFGVENYFKVNETKETALMLVIPNSVETYMKDNFPRVYTVKSKVALGTHSAFEQGERDGRFAMGNKDKVIA